MAADQIEREVRIAAPVERVWSLLTEGEHVGRWFGDAGAEIDLRPGGALLFRWAGHGVTRGRVEVVEPPRRFAYRWAPFAEAPRAGEEPVAGNSTLVEFTLAPDGDGTLLTVVESGFATLDGSDAERAEHRAGNTRGWRLELDELIAYAQASASGAADDATAAAARAAADHAGASAAATRAADDDATAAAARSGAGGEHGPESAARSGAQEGTAR